MHQLKLHEDTRIKKKRKTSKNLGTLWLKDFNQMFKVLRHKRWRRLFRFIFFFNFLSLLAFAHPTTCSWNLKLTLARVHPQTAANWLFRIRIVYKSAIRHHIHFMIHSRSIKSSIELVSQCAKINEKETSRRTQSWSLKRSSITLNKFDEKFSQLTQMEERRNSSSKHMKVDNASYRGVIDRAQLFDNHRHSL